MELFFIRHGQSANNALQDATLRDKDPELTPLGQQQAVRLAEFVEQGGHLSAAEQQEGRPVLDRLYCSPMLRAIQTTTPLAQALGLRPEVRIDLHEVGGIYLDHGPGKGAKGYPGRKRCQLQAILPELTLPDSVGEHGWWKGGMESAHAGQGRAIGVASWLREQAASQARIALISHGNFGNFLFQALGRQLPADGFYYEHGNTAISRLRLDPDGSIRVRYLNRLGHLPLELIS